MKILFLLFVLFQCKKNNHLGFGEYMSMIQNHHVKIYFSIQNENWKLAEYEIHEMNESLTKIETELLDREESKKISSLYPIVTNLENSIREKKIESARNEFSKLTDSCNSCHMETKFEFIKIQIPKSNPFSNQKFDLKN